MSQPTSPSAPEAQRAELAQAAPGRDDSAVVVAVLILGALLVIPGFLGLIS